MPTFSLCLSRCALALVLMSMVCAAHAWGVSGRHLVETGLLDCDLESAPEEFRIHLIAKERVLQIGENEKKIPYQEISESVLRFRFTPPGGPELSCDLEMPAGALTCLDAAGAAQVGFCITVP